MTAATASLLFRPQMQLRASPALLLHAALLSCTRQELGATVARELDDNPALERVWTAVGSSTTAPSLDDLPHRSTAAETLLLDVAAELASGDRWLAEWLIGNLDHRGFLGRTAEVIAAELGVAVSRVARVIAALRAVGPSGVCAVDAVDCLLLQLRVVEDRGAAPRLARTLLQHHLADLAASRFAAVAAALGTTTAEVVATRDFIRARLRPCAGLDDPGPAPMIAAPDIAIRPAPGGSAGFEVVVDTAERRTIRLDPLWEEMSGRAGSSDRQFLLRYRRRACAFIDGLDERAATLRTIAAHVAGHQRRWLLGDRLAHAALTRAQVAVSLGLHESTVSRAVAGKRVRLPDGRTVPFADLFGASGSVLAALRAIVADERRALSDAELATELAARGHAVARRTVAKYRGQLGIPARSAR